MGKVGRLRNRVEPFAALFLALGIVRMYKLYMPFPPARHKSTNIHKACPYMVIIGSILNEDAPPPPLFLSSYVIYLCCIVHINNT